MATWYDHTAELECREIFPIDMLRYDNCWPAAVEDSNKLYRNLRDKKRTTFRVNVRAVSQNKAHWTKDRWSSFGVRVIKTKCTKLGGQL